MKKSPLSRAYGGFEGNRGPYKQYGRYCQNLFTNNFFAIFRTFLPLLVEVNATYQNYELSSLHPDTFIYSLFSKMRWKIFFFTLKHLQLQILTKIVFRHSQGYVPDFDNVHPNRASFSQPQNSQTGQGNDFLSLNNKSPYGKWNSGNMRQDGNWRSNAMHNE